MANQQITNIKNNNTSKKSDNPILDKSDQKKDTATKSWSVYGNTFLLKDDTSSVNKLLPGIYTLEFSEIRGLYLEKTPMDKFEFNFKVYGLQDDFIERVVKYYNNSTGNLGVLLNGIKGTGKTVTAKELANRINIPVILINNKYLGLNSFIFDIQQDLVLFIDEYEKIYNEGKSRYGGDDENTDDSSLLSLMSGTQETKHRRVFLLTTNNKWINDNMINRPGRLRYVKEFNDLNLEQINEIIDDCLEDKKFRDDIILFLKSLTIITIDIVKEIINEINIFKESPFICCKNFNVENREETYKVVLYKPEVSEDKLVTIVDNIPVNNANYIMGKARKNLMSEISDENSNPLYIMRKDLNSDDSTDNTIYIASDSYDGSKPFKVKIIKERKPHSSFLI